MTTTDKTPSSATRLQDPAQQLRSDLAHRLNDSARPLPYSVLKAYRRVIDACQSRPQPGD